MDPIFTEEQLNRMSREDIISLLNVMQKHYQKQETKIQLPEKKKKIYPLLRRRKESNTNCPEKSSIVRTAEQNIRLSQGKP